MGTEAKERFGLKHILADDERLRRALAGEDAFVRVQLETEMEKLISKLDWRDTGALPAVVSFSSAYEGHEYHL
ncbi:MAG TPA: hypothetical protein HA362_06255 [Nanoarchaeota archaeon]|nr:hypothetical protein [Nanoarchaeota archaeon]